jgi:hypothetical protein
MRDWYVIGILTVLGLAAAVTALMIMWPALAHLIGE